MQLLTEFSHDELEVRVVESSPSAAADLKVVFEPTAEVLYAIPALTQSPNFPSEREVLMMVSKVGQWLADQRKNA